ncbi:MAG: homocysteine S-methyltransferase family protein [Ignavibacteriales bacterium]|nr:homocysteine S-methyltransferase family protein [Ignavibacteriales bacterium]
MHPLIQKFLSEQPVITDGAWGSQIQTLGLRPGECPDNWNLENPGAVGQVALSYVAAGSRIILTNTFGANRMMLERHGLSDKAAAINRAGAMISRKAAQDAAFVFGSIGPTGKMVFSGEVSEGELGEVFAEQAAALAEGGVHGFVIETMSELAEARMALKAAQRIGLPVVVSMTYDSGKGFERTMMGITPEEASEEFKVAGADVIGANCGMGTEYIVSICSRIRSTTNLPIWIKPNAGLPEVTNGRVTYNSTPESFAGYALKIQAAGANFIGGCCGTNPEYIRALKRVFSERS